MLAQNAAARDLLMREGKPSLESVKAEFYDIELRVAIMEQQGSDMQTLSAASSYFLVDGAGRNGRICPLAQ